MYVLKFAKLSVIFMLSIFYETSKHQLFNFLSGLGLLSSIISSFMNKLSLMKLKNFLSKINHKYNEDCVK